MNMKKILVSLVAGAVMTTAFAISAMAADVTVKTDDELEAALGTAAAGATIILEAGEYQAFDLARNSELNFKGMDGATVIASGSNSCYWPCFTGTVENIVFKAANNYSYPYNYSAIIFAHDTNFGEPCDITFKNCDFISSNGNSGIHFVGDVDFYNCDFVGNNSYSAMNYCCPSGDGIVIDGCTFNGTYSFASIHLAEGAGADTTISDCEINTGLIEFGSPKNIEFSENVINSTINLWSENNVIFDNNKFEVEAKISANSAKAVATILSTNTYADGMTAEDIIVSEKDGTVMIPVAKIGDEDYMTLQAAFDAAQDGDTIVLVEDVVITSEEAGSSGEGSNKFYMGVFYTGNKSFTFDMNGYSVSASNDDGVDNNVFRLRNLTDKDNVIYIKNGTIVADDIYYALDVGYSETAKTTLNIENVDFIVTRGKAYVLYARYNSIVNAKNVTINSEGSGAFIADYAEMTLDNCEAVVTGLIKNYPWNSIAVAAMGTPTSITVNGGSFTTYTTNKDSRMLSVVGVMSSGGNIVINGGEFTQVDENNVGGSYSLMYCDSEKGKESYITVNDGTFTAVKSLMQWNSSSPAGTSLVSLKGGKYNVKPVGNVGALCQVAEGFTLLEYSDGGYAVVADEFIGNESITVDFVDVTKTDAEGEKVYNINLVADTEKIINRLNSADLTFVLNVDSGEIDYEIVDIADDNIVINPVDNSKNRYEFHFETKTDVTNDTDDVITIAQVKFTGYGTFDFAVDTNANETNAVHATEILDNIVDTYVPAGTTTDTTVGELVVADDDITDITIKVPTRVLTINVDFPNSVEKNAVAYQQMTVKVSGGDLTKDIVINLGDTAVESEAIDLENEKPEANFSVNVATADKYVVTVAKALTVNTSYNVEVSGEGYRTARYTVTMTDAKTLNFWNNVKDNDTLVEEKKDSSAKKVTFLAGDIVKDSLINIYDLSAVVSYFGENMDTAKYNDYAKYDLNRDGKIDSKDVAYVLVSWNK